MEATGRSFPFRALLGLVGLLLANAVSPIPAFVGHNNGRSNNNSRDPSLLNLFKMFEESGSLGKGITVGKVQVALSSRDRSSSSIFGQLERSAKSSSSSSGLARLASEVCLALLRNNNDWVGACSDSKWFRVNDAGKAESLFNDWSNREAAKFEKEYIPSESTKEKGGGPTLAVVSVVVEIQGDTTKFDGAGFSLSSTKDVLSSIASDVQVGNGDLLNAVEVFWTPSERNEVLTKQDVIVDFPEVIDL